MTVRIRSCYDPQHDSLEEKLAQAYQAIGVLCTSTVPQDEQLRALDYFGNPGFDENFLPSRRKFLIGAAATLLAAPAIVRASSLMKVKPVYRDVWDYWRLRELLYEEAVDVQKFMIVGPQFFNRLKRAIGT